MLEKIRELAAKDPDAGIRYAAKKALHYWDASLSAQEGRFEVKVPRDAEGRVDVAAFAALLRGVVVLSILSVTAVVVSTGGPEKEEPDHIVMPP